MPMHTYIHTNIPIFSADYISTTTALPSHCPTTKATNQYLWSSTSELCEGDAPATFTSILFVNNWHVTDSPVPQQMGPLCTGELLTNSGLNECESTDATLPQQWNVAIVRSEPKLDGELCLNLSALHLLARISGKAWVIDGLCIDFLALSLCKYSAWPLSALSFSFFYGNLSFLISRPPLALYPSHF